MQPPVSYPGGTIDLRLHRPRERLGLIEQLLAQVTVGEDVLLVFPAPPQRIPAHIESRFPGRFILTPVAEGPAVWSVWVRPIA